MSDVMEYKCPACGGTMEFDSKSQKMKCPFCDSEMSVEEFQKLQEKEQGGAKTSSEGNSEKASGTNEVNWQAMGDGAWEEG